MKRVNLTPENKEHIDSLSYYVLLSRWRFSPSGDLWFQGETGDYWGKRMNEIKPENHVQISKDIGWY